MTARWEVTSRPSAPGARLTTQWLQEPLPAGGRLTKCHLLTDNDSELILGVAVTPAANDPDGPQAALVAAARAGGVDVGEVLGDIAYGDADTRVAVEDQGAKVTQESNETYVGVGCLEMGR
jgi:hypothetical protein